MRKDRALERVKPVPVTICVTFADGHTKRITFDNTVRFSYGFGDADASWVPYPDRDPKTGIVLEAEGLAPAALGFEA